MRIIIKTKNFGPTDALKSFVESKFFGLKKFIKVLDKDENSNTLAEIYVEVEKETKHHRKGDVFCAEAKVNLPGKTLVAKAKSDDLLRAVVETRDELKLEIEKYKFKNIDKNRRIQRKAKREIII